MRNDLINEREVASMLGVSLSTVRRWRTTGFGPGFRKIGSQMVRYERQVVKDWLGFVAPEVHSVSQAREIARRRLSRMRRERA